MHYDAALRQPYLMAGRTTGAGLAITFKAVSDQEECLRAGGVIATVKGSYDYTEKPICIEKPKRIPL